MSKNAFTKEQLRSYIERIERLEEEKRALTEDIKQVYAEAKGNGFVTGIIRQVVRDRRKDTVDYQEEQALLELYLAALGMLDK
ncbi:MAG: GapR family DNA-binding domain-containing protein, partial [Rhizomicrobium sp.]